MCFYKPSSLKPWAFSPSQEVVPRPQVVFLQPVVPQRPAPVHKGPLSKRRRHRKYLPILKSYPKIAPHPETRRCAVTSALPASVESHAAKHRPESSDGTLNAHSFKSDKIKRFCNTYNILRRSGLLDITLRTKELIRQNRRTQTELDLLREHTDLFMQALQTGDSSIWSRLRTNMQEDDRGKDRTPPDPENMK
ncbi:CLOCK-interacting pacemaker-like [Carassius auratus]|uniref:CLOCK-interacting pacemaker-like n=1 Tax=Carassius auratus TaxID=7957 RepID=A0A6P6NBB1_CARAU|nr:CLOCK-interacting pacemaker-like [Carassius auratus]